MRGVKRSQGSTGRMKKHRYSNEFKVTAVKMANAHMESFFHSMKAEGIHGATFADTKAVAQHVYRYIPFYNSKRKHSALGYMTPLEYEKKAV